MRRTLILGAVALVVLLAAGFFLFFQNSGEPSGDTSSGQGGGFFASLFPFNFGGGGGAAVDSGNGETPIVDERPIPRLRQVSAEPVGGGFLFTSDRASTTIRYVERATGHIYETAADSLTARRISNTTIPGVFETFWEDENNLIIRYLTENLDIETFAITLAEAAEEEQTVNGIFVPSWDRAALDPERETLFTVTRAQAGSSASLFRADGSNPRTVLASPISSWVPLQSRNDLFLQTAPAPEVPGYLFRVSNQNLVRALGPADGLMAVVSPSGRYILSSANTERGIELSVFDTSSNEAQTLPLATLAPKCAFVSETPVRIFCGVPSEFPGGEYPTDWLLGRVAVSDDLWLISLPDGAATFLAAPSEDYDVSLDIENVIVDEEGSYVGFTNKNDLTFWVFRTTDE